MKSADRNRAKSSVSVTSRTHARLSHTTRGQLVAEACSPERLAAYQDELDERAAFARAALDEEVA